MSGAGAGVSQGATKVTTDDRLQKSQSTQAADESTKPQLEEDDEFEDFPVEDWPDNETSLQEGNAHLWEESWDDDDNKSDDFAQILKQELTKVNAQNKG